VSSCHWKLDRSGDQPGRLFAGVSGHSGISCGAACGSSLIRTRG
jgi:hypothetical protein